MYKEARIDLIKAFIQFNGNVRLTHTTYNYDGEGGVKFSGCYMDGSTKPIHIVMDKYQVGAVMDCETITELHNCYDEMGYF